MNENVIEWELLINGSFVAIAQYKCTHLEDSLKGASLREVVREGNEGVRVEE